MWTQLETFGPEPMHLALAWADLAVAACAQEAEALPKGEIYSEAVSTGPRPRLQHSALNLGGNLVSRPLFAIVSAWFGLHEVGITCITE